MELKVKEQMKGITLIALVITIIVLLILAGVSIAMLTGPNGLITNAQEAKTKTEEAGAQEKVQIAAASSYGVNGFDKERFNDEIENLGGKVKLEDPLVVEMDGYEVALDGTTGEIESTQDTTKVSQLKAPEEWETTTLSDPEWYNYGGTGETKVKVNTPKLKGGMTPVKFTNTEITETETQWANAITTDGSMWVWIPRYAYRIKSGYHTAEAGEIEVAFIDTANNFLNNDSNGKKITENPSEVTYSEGDKGEQNEWLVHPAFTANADNGGGFGELTGIWVGKFEATGSEETLTIKPGEQSLRNMTANAQYQLAKRSTFGESITAEELGSHMAKNSEWGAVAYLGHSKYGINKQKVEQNTSAEYYTGGSNDIKTIYETNSNQSTTHNATGVYDMNGGAWERVASYVNNDNDNLKTNGGEQSGDLYGEEEEHGKSTKYKTVYGKGDTDEAQKNYERNSGMKGDAVWETSTQGCSDTASLFSAFANFPYAGNPSFGRGGIWSNEQAGSFAFGGNSGIAFADGSFRPVLSF